MSKIVYWKSDATASGQYLAQLADLYAEAFAEPPYEEGPEDVARFRRWFKDELKNPGFSLVRAIDGELLIGMSYGFTMPAADWWTNAIDTPPDVLYREPKFAIMEWAVRPGSRLMGVGRRLMDELLNGRTEPYATLLVNSRSNAKMIYSRWGWEPCGRVRTATPMEIMMLQLRN